MKTDSNYHINSMFIIPLNHKSLICKIENNEIREVGSYPNTTDSKSIIKNKRGQILSLKVFNILTLVNFELLKTVECGFIR